MSKTQDITQKFQSLVLEFRAKNQRHPNIEDKDALLQQAHKSLYGNPSSYKKDTKLIRDKMR